VHKSGGQPPFTWQDAAFLESLGNTTAVAIQNAQLLKSLEIKNEEIQSLSAHNVQRLEEERAHIARELHDEAGQMLIGIKLGLQVLARRFGEDAVPLREELDRLRELVNHSTAQIKNIARRLRPPILDQLGLHVTLRQLSADFSDFTGIVVDCQLEAIPERLPAAAEIALYRIAQEALTNAARHAQATQVELQLWLDHPLLHFSVRDNGVGFVDGSTSRGLGLLGMRERAEMLNAIFSLRTGRGEGTLITVSIPYETDHPC
jgi:two-component system sensor histidine kinase UhpB